MKRILESVRQFPPRYDALLVATLAAAAYAAYGLAWPLQPGRDFQSYLIYYLSIFRPGSALSGHALFRTPGTPLFLGLTYDTVGVEALEFILGGIYTLAILAWWLSVRQYGRAFAFVVVGILILYPPYGILFHSAASENLFAAGFSFWVLGIVGTKASSGKRAFVVHGIAVGLLCLIRPSSQVLLLFALFPVFCFGVLSWRERLMKSGLFTATTCVILLIYSGYNQYRHGEFLISRPTSAIVPFYRLFIVDRLIKPSNGPVSAELAEHVREKLLPYEPYKSRGVDVDAFFSSGNVFMWADFAGMHDHVYGWESRYCQLRAASWEALQRYPVAYAKGVATDLGRLLLIHGYSLPRISRTAPDSPPKESHNTEKKSLGSATVQRGQISHSRDSYLNHGARGHELTPAEHRRIAAELQALHGNYLPARDGSDTLQWFFQTWTLFYPQMGTFILLGVGGILLRRPKQSGVYLFLMLLAGSVLVITCASVNISYAFRVPFDPLCIVIAAIGLAAPTLSADKSEGNTATRENA